MRRIEKGVKEGVNLGKIINIGKKDDRMKDISIVGKKLIEKKIKIRKKGIGMLGEDRERIKKMKGEIGGVEVDEGMDNEREGLDKKDDNG